MSEDANNEAFMHKWRYICEVCGATWLMNFYDRERLTNQPLMPCGHTWEHLNMTEEQPGDRESHE